MSLVSRIMSRFGYSKTPALPARSGKRAYAAGIVNRLTQGWGSGVGSYSRSMDAELRYTLRIMRARSRDLYQNNDYFKRFSREVVKNVVGPKGFAFKNMAKNPDGKLDILANQIIKDAFAAWCKRSVCDVTGKLSWTDCQRLFIQTVAQDGEVLVRKVRGFDNPYRFAIQFLEADHLDENLNVTLSNGNEIRMGIEFNQWDRPVAYHILVRHPGDYTWQRYGNIYEVVPASDMIHAFVPERARQSRGVPWGHSTMTRLNNLGGFEEAAIISARTGASKMGFLIPPDDASPYTGDDTDDQGNIITEVEPGTLEQLPAGWDFKDFNPNYPNGEFEPFMKRTLRGIAAGLDISYHRLSCDLEGVNYSSARAGELDDRDTWAMLQSWMAETFQDDVFAAWLDIQLMGGKTLIFQNGNSLPYAKFDKFNTPSWRPRTWPWVDPLKDIMASEKELANKLTTRTRIAAECGEDIEEIFAEIKRERELAKQYGIELIDPMPAGSTVKMPNEPTGSGDGANTPAAADAAATEE